MVAVYLVVVVVVVVVVVDHGINFLLASERGWWSHPILHSEIMV